MVRRGMAVGLGLFAASCGGLQSTAGNCTSGDTDRDGICNTEDPCPVDAANDADGDGICESDDPCPDDPDPTDDDDDGWPDACDPCPDDPENDADGDGTCASEDPCPDDPDDACGRRLLIATQVDWFHEEASWEMSDSQGTVLASGGFDGPGDGGWQQVDVPAEGVVVFTTRDEGGDGGIRGFVWDPRREVRVLAWGQDSYRSIQNLTFDPSTAEGQEGPLPFTTTEWLNQTRCDVEIQLQVDGFPAEQGWELLTRDASITARFPGSFEGTVGAQRVSVGLVDGDYTIVQYDDYGDGWESPSALTVFVEGSPDPLVGPIGFADPGPPYDGEIERSFDFTLDCP